MEKWITRVVATICAAGSTALFWTLGVFFTVPWRENRIWSLTSVELQVIGISLTCGLAATWGVLHLFALADRAASPCLYRTARACLLVASALAIWGGMSWAAARIA